MFSFKKTPGMRWFSIGARVVLACAAVTSVALVPSACGSKSEELAFDRAPITSIADCPDVGEGPIKKLCVTDDHGQYYWPFGDAGAPNGGMLVVPGGRKVSIAYVFEDGYVPDADDVATSGARMYVAPLDVASHLPGGCCSEDDEANRVAAHAILQGGTMVVSLDDVPADAMQVAGILDFATLYAKRLGAGCTLPGDACQAYARANGSGFAVRFYVGRVPGT